MCHSSDMSTTVKIVLTSVAANISVPVISILQLYNSNMYKIRSEVVPKLPYRPNLGVIEQNSTVYITTLNKVKLK